MLLAITSRSHDIQLHIFCDATEKGFAAVEYLRMMSPENKITAAFVSNKTRFAPIKSVTILRLELKAAFMGWYDFQRITVRI